MKTFFNYFINKLYGKFNGKLFPLVAVPGSYLALLYLLFIKKKNQVIILPTSALGDAVYVFSFWENLYNLSIDENKQLLFFISDRYKQIAESFLPPISKIVYLKHLGMKHLLLLMLSASLYNVGAVDIARNLDIIATIPRAHKKYLNKRKIIGTRNQLAQLLKVPLTPISYHQLPLMKVKSIPDFDQCKRKICIINPYSYSMNSSYLLYETICKKLLKLGFYVYTNVVGNQKVIDGSKPLNCSIEELYSIASAIPLVVSIRSGILDFLIPSKVNMFVIYEKWNDLDVNADKNSYCLKEWQPKGFVHEAYMENFGDENKILDEFDVYLKTLKLEV